jgi:hypothetical protein
MTKEFTMPGYCDLQVFAGGLEELRKEERVVSANSSK